MSRIRLSIVALCLYSLTLAAQANCTDIGILADYGVIGENDFDYGTNSSINGNDITGNGNTPTPTGTTQTVDLNFPPIDPAQFPATGGDDLRNPSVVDEDSYGKIEGRNQTITFTGGDYFIEELDLKNNVTIVLAPGNYFIEDANIGNGFNLIISPEGPVRIHVGDEFKVDQNTTFNSPGNTGDLIFYLHNDADFEVGTANQGSSAPDFNGIIYSPFANSEVEFKNNNNITGAILSAGKVEVGENTSFDYSESVKADVLEALGCQPVSGPDHYHISHAGSGITCEPSTVSITAHNADHSPFIATSDMTLTVAASPAVDSIIPINPTILAGDSSTSVQISRSTVTSAPHIDINVSDGTLSETSGSAETNPASADYDDPKLQFVETLFVFSVFDPSTGTTGALVPTQIAGKPTSTAPANTTMTLRAITAGDPQLTAECQAALTPGIHNIEIGYQCIDSTTCSANELLLSNQLAFDPGSVTTLARNSGATFGNSTSVALSFDAGGVAPIALRYDNAGRIALFAETLVIAPGNVINRGVSNDFVVRPFALPLDFGDSGDGDGDLFDMREDDFINGGLDGSNNDISYADSDPTANPQNSSVFKIAGEDFTAEVSAVLWQSADDANGDGLPDSNANLYDNSLATLFGQELTPPLLTFNHTLKSPGPSGGNSGNLQATFSAAYNGGKTLGTLNWSEVGIIDISVSLPDYLGDGLYNAATTTRDVGRFRPAGFRLSAINDGVFEHACGSFTYSGQGFGFLNNPSFVVEAINALPGPTVTQNYTGLWSKLDAATSFNLTAPATAITGTDGNPLSIEPTAAPTVSMTDNGNGSFALSFDDTTFCYGVGSPCTKQENSVLAPFDSDISFTLQSITDGEVSTGFGQVFSPLATPIRYGRLAMDNIFGSELTTLTMPMYTEYFDGSNYLLNGEDFCTQVLAADLAQDNPEGLVSTISVINSPPSLSTGGGILNVELTAPGAGNTGPITLTPDLGDLLLPNHTIPPDPVAPSWLQHDWDADAAGLENPSATATFGIFKGNSRQIYYRQIFR